MTLLLTYIIVTVVVSFLCSLLEAILLSSSTSFLALKAKENKKYGQILKNLKDDIDRPLSAILTLNTIANTSGAAAIGAQVHNIYGDQWVAMGSALLTFIILIFSEIVPKTLGASHWRTLAPFAAYALRAMVVALFPIVFLTEKISDLFGGGKIHRVTREEMIVTAELGADNGTLKRKESTIIRNLLMLDNIFIDDIMTPRSVMMALPAEYTVAQVMEKYKPIRYSRIPVYKGDLDNIEGVVHRYEILEASSHDLDDKKIGSIMTPVHTIPENISVSACLDQLIHRNEHIFIVVDDYGVTTGLVTLEDAIETLLGVEIVDEFDSVADLRAYALEQWKKRKKAKGSLESVNG